MNLNKGKNIVIKMFGMALIYILIFNIETSDTHELDKVVMNLIVDVINSLYHPSLSATVFMCENTDNVKGVSEFLSKHYKLHTIVILSKNHQLNLNDFKLSHKNFYVLDLDCPGSTELIVEINKHKMFSAPGKWLILQESRSSLSPNETQIKNIFENLNVFPDSEVTIAQRIDDTLVKLLSIYRPNAIASLIIEYRGLWSNKNPLQLQNNEETSRRRTNIMRTQLRAACVITNPDTMNHWEDFKDRKVDGVSKVGRALTKLLADRMNATVHFTFTPTWGYQSPNGSWDGMIGGLLRDEIDLGGTGIFITEPRLTVVSYIHLYTPTRVRFIFRRPPLSFISNLFILPFSGNVWFAIVIFCCLGYTVLYFSLAREWKIIEKIAYNDRLWGDLEIKPAFGDNFLIVIGAITQQGSAYEPRTGPARIAVFMLLVTCLSLYAAYTANIVALLQSSSDSIKNVKDLMQSPLELGLQDIVYNHYYMGKFEDPLRKEFYERRIKHLNDPYMSTEDGIHKVRTELFAFHTDLVMGYDVVKSTYEEDEKCGFEEIDYLYVSDPTFIIQRQSPYVEIFRVGGLWLEETGLAQRFIDKIYHKKPECNNQKKFISVGTVDCYAAYLVIAYGLGVTLAILVCEILWFKKFDHYFFDKKFPEIDDEAGNRDVNSIASGTISDGTSEEDLNSRRIEEIFFMNIQIPEKKLKLTRISSASTAVASPRNFTMRDTRSIITWLSLTLLTLGRSHRMDKVMENFITDVSSSFLISSSFTGFFCMQPDDAGEFSREISRKYLLHNMASFNDSDLADIDQAVAHNNYFVVDLDCPDGVDFLLKVNMRKLFIAPAKWLLLRDSRDQDRLTGLPSLQSMVEITEDKLISVLSRFDIFPDSEVIVGQRLNKTTVELSSIYRPSSDHSVIIEDLGSWEDGSGFRLCSHDHSSRRRVNLRGTVLKTSLVMTDLNTLNHLTDYQDKLIDAVTKASYMWIVYLAERMNATFNFTVERTWGYKNEDGNWNGMIGLLDRGEINIGGTATFMISQRIGVVDYVQLYTPTGSRFLFRRPPLSYVSNIFTLPFARSVWIAIVVFLSISFVFLYIAMKWEWEKIQVIPVEFRLGGDLERKPTVTDNLLVLLGAIFQQGFSCEPRTISTRIVVLMVLIIALSLYAAYTANIVALLQSTADSINTLDDLMNSPLKIGIFDIVYNRYYFGAFEDPVRKEFYERLVKDKPAVWMPLEDGIRKVKEGLFAFHVDLGFGYQMMQETYTEDEKCGIEEIDYLNVYDPLLVIERQSPFREIIRVGALWIAETGLKHRVASKFFTQKPPCSGSTSFVSVGIIDCYVAMIAIVYGCAISIGILLLECLWRKWIGGLRKPENNSPETFPKSSLTADDLSVTQSSRSLQIEEILR
ncbi:uncharacterized protein LOC135161814 [Diachasmimorpha longicaudata]|uniref:uncharacterized protein LOC135161814 n=1 Tax=Diachasmimorpha longicaudata TaxID=58733 RepID=UPI0030B8E973